MFLSHRPYQWAGQEVLHDQWTGQWPLPVHQSLRAVVGERAFSDSFPDDSAEQQKQRRDTY